MPEQIPNRVLSAAEQIAQNGLVTDVPGFGAETSPAEFTDDSAEKQEASLGRVLSEGERVSVLRNPKPGSTEKWVDHSGWKVVETNPSETRVEKIMPNGVEVSTKTIPTAELVDLQERLAEKLRHDIGAEAVEGSGIREPDSEGAPKTVEIKIPMAETEKDPIDDLSEEVKAEVLEYRRAVSNKKESERNNDFAQAAEDGRALHRVRQSLSREALDFLKISR